MRGSCEFSVTLPCLSLQCPRVSPWAVLSALSYCHYQLSPELESVGFNGDTEDHSDGGGLRNS